VDEVISDDDVLLASGSKWRWNSKPAVEASITEAATAEDDVTVSSRGKDVILTLDVHDLTNMLLPTTSVQHCECNVYFNVDKQIVNATAVFTQSQIHPHLYFE